MLIYIDKNQNFNMRSIRFLLLVLVCFSGLSFSQETVTALITDPRIGSENGNEFLSAVIKDINSRKNIESVIVLGNMTASGKYDEFLSAQSILSELKLPFRVIGGPRDIFLSEGRGIEINRLLAGGNIYYKSESSDKVYLQTIYGIDPLKTHIPVETINSISSYKSTYRNVLIYSYFPLDDKVDNWFKLSNLFTGKNIVIFSSLSGNIKEFASSIKNFRGISSANNKEWAYNIIVENTESIKFYMVDEKNTVPKLIDTFVKNGSRSASKIDSLQLLVYNQSIEIKNKLNINRTTFSPLLLSDDKIFIASKDGLIICRDKQDNIIWQYNTDGIIYSSLLRDKDLIIIITNDGDLFTINTNTGDLVQVIGIGEPITSDIRLIDLEYNKTKTKGIVFGTAFGNIYCYELYSLEMVWQNYLTEQSIIAKPVVVNNKLIYQDNDENYYCVNAKNGVLIWKWKPEEKSKNVFFKSDVISNGKSVFVTDDNGKLHSIDLLLGIEKWNKKKLFTSGKFFINSNRKILIIHSKKNKIVLINQTNGRVKKEIKLPDEFKSSLPTCYTENGNNILLGFDNGFICSINKNNILNKILFTGTAPIISLLKTGKKEFIMNNMDGKVIQFSLP